MKGFTPKERKLISAFNEMLNTANWAWAMYPGLSEGAVATLEDHGTDEQKSTYLSKLISGVWSGTFQMIKLT